MAVAKLATGYVDMVSRTVVDLTPMPNAAGWYLVNRINVPAARRGQGLGTIMLVKLLGLADAAQATLLLEPSASPEYVQGPRGGFHRVGLGQRHLERWYQRYGFYWCNDDGTPCKRSNLHRFMRRDPVQP